ncbi:MAG: winged helix-turn-helix domain-containing protein, partial [Erysipelotrichaceae bacterium]|nr:winged helix-turn-helix domain-containing protein [Erysipelotrichaceae bacterium]
MDDNKRPETMQRITTKELADAVHLTPTPVFERQKRLEKQGY